MCAIHLAIQILFRESLHESVRFASRKTWQVCANSWLIACNLFTAQKLAAPFFFVFFFLFVLQPMTSPLFVDPKVCLSHLQRQLSPLRAPPMEGEAFEKEFEFLIEENYLAPSSFKFYHVKSGRPDEWMWLIPHSCSPEAEDDADSGIIAFLRRSKSGILCFGSCGEYHWASPVGPIHFTNFACEMSPKIPTHNFTWYPVRGENLAVSGLFYC